MRWRMCPKCGTKMTHEVSEIDLDMFRCNYCKASYMDIRGELLKYVESKAKEKNMEADEFLIDILDKMTKNEMTLI